MNISKKEAGENLSIDLSCKSNATLRMRSNVDNYILRNVSPSLLKGTDDSRYVYVWSKWHDSLNL